MPPCCRRMMDAFVSRARRAAELLPPEPVLMPRYCSASEMPPRGEAADASAERVGESVRCNPTPAVMRCGCCCCMGDPVRWNWPVLTLAGCASGDEVRRCCVIGLLVRATAGCGVYCASRCGCVMARITSCEIVACALGSSDVAAGAAAALAGRAIGDEVRRTAIEEDEGLAALVCGA